MTRTDQVLAAAPPASQLRGVLDNLARQRQDLAHRGSALLLEWKERFPKGTLPLKLVRMGGESNTLLRWRCSGSAHQPRGGRIELADARMLIEDLSAPVRARILLVEQTRIALNYEYAVVVYAQARLMDVERHRASVSQLRRVGNPAATRRI